MLWKLHVKGMVTLKSLYLHTAVCTELNLRQMYFAELANLKQIAFTVVLCQQTRVNPNKHLTVKEA